MVSVPLMEIIEDGKISSRASPFEQASDNNNSICSWSPTEICMETGYPESL